jgi:hypothetical protein
VLPPEKAHLTRRNTCARADRSSGLGVDQAMRGRGRRERGVIRSAMGSAPDAVGRDGETMLASILDVLSEATFAGHRRRALSHRFRAQLTPARPAGGSMHARRWARSLHPLLAWREVAAVAPGIAHDRRGRFTLRRAYRQKETAAWVEGGGTPRPPLEQSGSRPDGGGGRHRPAASSRSNAGSVPVIGLPSIDRLR